MQQSPTMKQQISVLWFHCSEKLRGCFKMCVLNSYRGRVEVELSLSFIKRLMCSRWTTTELNVDEVTLSIEETVETTSKDFLHDCSVAELCSQV